MIISIIIGIVLAGLALLGYCTVASSASDENEREREDEEQMEYLRKWKEAHEKH